jgi:hypothetical protein
VKQRQKGGVVKYRSVRYIFYVVVKFINLRFIIRIKLVRIVVVCKRCNSCGTQLSPRFMIPHNFSHPGPTPTYVGVRTRAQKTKTMRSYLRSEGRCRISLRFGVGYCRCYSPKVIFIVDLQHSGVRESRRLYTVNTSNQRTTSAARPICTHLLGIRSTGRYGN